MDAKVRSLVAAAIRDSKKSRSQIAGELGERVGRAVTVRMLDDYTANSKVNARFPAAWIEAFCAVTGDDRLQRLVLSSRLRQCLELGEFDLDRELVRKRLLREG